MKGESMVVGLCLYSELPVDELMDLGSLRTLMCTTDVVMSNFVC